MPEERLPMITNIAKKFNGIDAATEMIPVRPAAHYTMEEYPLTLRLKRRSAAYSVPAKGRIKHTWGEPPQIQLNKRCFAFWNIAGIMAARWAESHSIPDLSAGKVKLEEKKLSQKISVKDALIELSKICVIADGARRSVAEIPDRSQKIADTFGLKLYPKIARS